jgi:hypothetical protein
MSTDARESRTNLPLVPLVRMACLPLVSPSRSRFSPIWARLEQVLFPAWEDPGGLDLRRLVDQSKQQLAGVSRADALVHEALSRASSLVDERLSLFAYPAIYTPEDSEGIQKLLTTDR